MPLADLEKLVQTLLATIRNPHTRRAYARPCAYFFAWCERYLLTLAAIVMLFNWPVIGQIVPFNPAAVRGSKHIVKRGNPLDGC